MPNLVGYRKTIVAVATLAATGLFLVSGHISAADFVDLHKFVLPSFFAANLGEFLMNNRYYKKDK